MMVTESRVKKTLINARVNLIFYLLILVLSCFSRKTSLFHCSHKDAENYCIIRSFIETYGLHHVPVVAWFRLFFNAMLQGVRIIQIYCPAY